MKKIQLNIGSMRKKVQKSDLLKKSTAYTKNTKQKFITTMKKRPLTVFSGMLIALLLVIAAGNMLRAPEQQEAIQQENPTPVATYTIGSAPRIIVNGTVEKTGVVTIVAQTSGVVQDILCTEGDDFYRGQTLVRLSTNYQGGNALSIQRQIAQKSYQQAEETFLLQTDIINKQRSIASETEDNDDELRDITKKSLDETQALIDLNENSLDIIDELIETTENASNPTTDAEKEKILALKQQKSGLLSGLNSAKAALRTHDYTTGEGNPPDELANLSKDLTMKQLELQEKTLQLNKEISLLQLRLAQVNEALMYPASPFSGRIERVHVKPGQIVNPGTPIATISGSEQSVSVVAYVPEQIAKNISSLEESSVMINGEALNIMPTYVAQEPTNNQLFAVLYNLPDAYSSQLVEKSRVEVHIPVGYAQTGSVVPFIPIDAVYQTQDAAYIYLFKNGLAESREVKLGNLYGSLVEITSGLTSQEKVILDRSVSQGDAVEEL